MAGDEDERGPFAELYEQWCDADPPQHDAAIEAQLRATYRDAWKNDIADDRLYVMSFIRYPFDAGNKDILIEALRSTDARIAQVASITASVTVTLSVTPDTDLETDPEVRKAFRELVRRFPEDDFGRARAFYGHLPGDADDSAQRPFLNLFEDWMADDFPRDPAIKQRLADTYREAWASDDSVERAFVLRFLNLNRSPGARRIDGSDLVIEGLLSDDPRLATTAAYVAEFLIHDRVDLGPDIRPSLEMHRARFPDRFGPARWALEDLDRGKRRGKRRSPRTRPTAP